MEPMDTSGYTASTEVYLLSKPQLDHYRDKIDACLDAEPELWNRRFASKEDVWHNVLTDYVQMWAICDANCIYCVLMTEIVSHPKRYLRLFWAYGERLVESFPCVDLVIERFAHGMECEELVIEGRRGWEKVIKASGGEFVCSTYRRPVRLTKGH